MNEIGRSTTKRARRPPRFGLDMTPPPKIPVADRPGRCPALLGADRDRLRGCRCAAAARRLREPEPGALTALVNLKLSGNAQFQDGPGACKLIETAVPAAIRRWRRAFGVPRRLIAGAAPGGSNDRAFAAMPETVIKPKTRVKTKTERPRLHKVILVNDDFTPREFVVRC